MEKYWFEQERGPRARVHESVINTARSIYSDQTSKYSDYERYASAYKERHVTSFDPGDWGRDRGESVATLTYNVVRACVDTMTSRITMHEPMVKVLTSDAPESDQERARLMERFITGAMQGGKWFVKARKAFKDACIYGMGVLKVYPGDGAVEIECIHPSRMVVDDNAALDGAPQSLYQLHHKSRAQLKALYPDKAAQIDDVRGRRLRSDGKLTRDLVEVWEAWHLPVGDCPGRYVCAIDTATLADEDYADEHFPFAIVRWSEDLQGWHGIGLAEELEGIQETINELTEKIKDNMDLLAVPYILKHKGAEVSDEHLATNLRARIIEYVGPIPPKVETPPGVHPQVLQWLEQLYQRAFEIAGISQMSATSQKPNSALRSALAVMTVQDVETQRFSTVSHNWNDFAVDTAMCILRAGKKVQNWSVQASSKDFIQRINWSDVSMKDDRFVIHVYPQSSLPRQPAGRRQFVVEMTQAQVIRPEEARQLLELGDVDKYQRLANAPLDDLERIFELMLADDGEYIPPVEFAALDLGIQLAVRYYHRAHLDRKDPDKIANITRWIQEATELLAPPPPPEQMLPPGGELAPGVAPAPPAAPVNPLAPAA